MMSEAKKDSLDEGCHIAPNVCCIANEFPDSHESCNSSDALALYEHEGEGGIWYDAFCWSCNQNFSKEEVHSSSHAEYLGVDPISTKVVNKKEFTKVTKKPPISKEQLKKIFQHYTFTSNNYRGIKDQYYKEYGHLFLLNDNGTVKATFYPEHLGSELQGYKSRYHPKDFTKGTIGSTGAKNDMSGQFLFRDGGKYSGSKHILIVGGEQDKVAAFQMLRESQLSQNKGNFAPIAVVSPTTGESSAAKHIQRNYEFFDSFEVITVGMDNDEAGIEATRKICEVLPRDKIRIATWSGKDPNNMLNEGNSKQFVREFWRAREFSPSGIIGSGGLHDLIVKELLLEKVPLPDFLWKLQKLMAGGIPLGYIVLLAAATGIGKTTIINELVYFWIFNSPYRVGIISLELDAGQYGIAMLSRHLGDKLNLYEDGQSAVDVVQQEGNLAKGLELYTNDYGEDRFVLLDERTGTVDELKKKILQMILQFDCKFIVIDPLTDAIDGMPEGDQAVFMKWLKFIVKEYKVTILPVCHVRKLPSGAFRDMLKEDDIQGSSSQAKSAAASLLFNRDKVSEDNIVKNTTTVWMPKCRWTGNTGMGNPVYYNNKTHTMWDLHKYFETYPDELPMGYNLDEMFEEKQEMKKAKSSFSKMTIPEKPDFVEMGDGVVL
jgi:archaellum biogenesis ATPase FlaH